jgi:hypothetical protein
VQSLRHYHFLSALYFLDPAILDEPIHLRDTQEQTMSRTVKLWCSQSRVSIPRFEIAANHDHEQILQAIQKGLGIDVVVVYHADAGAQIEDLESQVYTGQVLVVSSNPILRLVRRRRVEGCSGWVQGVEGE